MWVKKYLDIFSSCWFSNEKISQNLVNLKVKTWLFLTNPSFNQIQHVAEQ